MRIELTPAELIELIRQGVAAIMLADPAKIIAILTRMEAHMSAELDALTAQVAGTHATIESAIVLINGIADRIAAAGTDPAALAALTADLRSEDVRLAAAVAASTASPGAPVIT